MVEQSVSNDTMKLLGQLEQQTKAVTSGTPTMIAIDHLDDHAQDDPKHLTGLSVCEMMLEGKFKNKKTMAQVCTSSRSNTSSGFGSTSRRSLLCRCAS